MTVQPIFGNQYKYSVFLIGTVIVFTVSVIKPVNRRFHMLITTDLNWDETRKYSVKLFWAPDICPRESLTTTALHESSYDLKICWLTKSGLMVLPGSSLDLPPTGTKSALWQETFNVQCSQTHVKCLDMAGAIREKLNKILIYRE